MPTTPMITTLGKLNKSIEQLEKREIFITKRIAHQMKIARQKIKAGNKKAALPQMRQKRMYTKELDKLHNMKINLQQQIISLEGTHMTLNTVEALREGSKTMKTLIKENNVEEIENLYEDIQDQQQTMEEINTIIGQAPLIDEDDLEKELEELMAADITEKLMALPTNIPTNISTHISTPTIIPEETHIMEELEREMAMA